MGFWARWFGGKPAEQKERRGQAGLGDGARRVPFEGEVTLVQGGHKTKARSGDLSEGGVFVETPIPPGVGCHVRVVLRLDDTVTLTAEGCVRWLEIVDERHVAGCGVSFEPLSDETRAAVRAVLDRLESQERRRALTDKELERARRFRAMM